MSQRSKENIGIELMVELCLIWLRMKEDRLGKKIMNLGFESQRLVKMVSNYVKAGYKISELVPKPNKYISRPVCNNCICLCSKTICSSRTRPHQRILLFISFFRSC